MALSAAHACLYGVAHCVIVALGCAPGLGFVHTGHERSFVYDIADLYKAEVTIPIAFEVTASNPADIGSATRHAVRETFSDGRILERIAKDIRLLILKNSEDENFDEIDDDNIDIVSLWDEKSGFVRSGVSYEQKPMTANTEAAFELEEGYGTILEDI
jgi:CRISPR-associated protein Cas1